MNATEAYMRVFTKANYNTARTNSSRLLADANISAEVEALKTERMMERDEILLRLADHARGSIAPFLKQEDENVYLDLATESAKANIHLIKRIEQRRVIRSKKNGEEKEEEVFLKIEIHDPQAALVQMGRHKKLFSDSMEHSGTVKTVGLTLDQWKEERDKRRAKAAENVALFDDE